MRHLSEIADLCKARQKRVLSVAYGEDPHTIGAIAGAVNENMVDAIITGHKGRIEKVASDKGVDPSIFTIIDIPDEKSAAKEAVRLVKSGRAHFLMKGLCGTSTYMRAILDKEEGLMEKGALLSHVTVIEIPTYPKLLILSDVAVLLAPTLKDKVKMIGYCTEIAHKLGIETPKAAIICAVEKVNPKMPATLDAAILSKMADRGQIKGVIVDGPLALDVAVSKECAEIKHLESDVAGDADIFILPNIETANVFYKSLTQLANGKLAAVVTGATCPCVLTSRGDTDESKFFSIALAALMS
ncbi:phosphate butyryltransferase [candidate division WOR-3 bacterium JGI_Cruoil_03_44_89]|uniref:Phosphate butyryltransferase n=1 Tax=candidate division WOR-3 bacterium JGI_Cruoil_03_44_89 TaxID=1973748 RepID=A0A235BPH8_UNCW3|nr:MAG: phosphate butyryltransferase [candidate division WOR-3 bacterium JGI_Cruoil_03_44_89]